MKPSITKKGTRLYFKGKFCDFSSEWSDVLLQEDGWFSIGETGINLRLAEEKYQELEDLLNRLGKSKKKVLENGKFFSVYTDGSAAPTNPGPGGWGCVMYDANEKEVSSAKGGNKWCGNGRMEITGVTEGLRLLPEGVKADFWIDAKYALDTVGSGPLDPKGPGGWIKGWKAKGWKKADGEEVKNLPEVKALWSELTRHCEAGTKIDFKWVKSHSGVKGNERADELANEGRKKFAK